MRLSKPTTLLLTPFLLLPLSLHAQQHRAAPPATEHPTDLPVTRVSLYKNGIGFFEHTGHVTGNAQVNLSFTSGQLNDVLQSLTAIDLNGGRISGAGYNSTTPLEQQLKNLSLNIAENPTAADFYAAIRGARVEVHSGAVTIAGRLLSVESRETAAKSPDDTPATPRNYITVLSDSGDVRTVELTTATSVRLTDTALHTDVTRYLQLLDSNRNQGFRHLTLTDRGPADSKATRELKVSYISEVPIWKSTYRILFTDANASGASTSGAPSSPRHDQPGASDPASSRQGGVNGGTLSQTATLQGWSVVDNTTGTDWINVQLSLIAGAPQSFIQPLSQPIYSRRPEIPIAQEAQLAPQTHESSIDGATENVQVDKMDQFSKLAPAPAQAQYRAKSAGVAGMSGSAGLAPGVVGFNDAAGSYSVSGAPAVSYEQAATASLSANTSTAAFDDFFAYNLTEPVTILKNESALVPILQTKIDADRVTLVSSNGTTTSQPLRALWITNTSGLTLDRGSFSIVENGNFGGEGLLDPIHAGEKRLLSYAADQAIHVSTDTDKTTNHVTLIRGSHGVINIHRADLHDLTFAIHNAAADRRTVLLELPTTGGYKITSEPQPAETTASVYRFRTEVPAGQTVHLTVSGERNGFTTYYLTRSDDNQITFLLNETHHNPAFEAALQPILEARVRVAEAQMAVNQTDTKLTALHADEERQRANITALATADKSSRERFVHDLNKTEDAITAAQAELATRTTALEAAKTTLANRIEALDLNIAL